MLNYFQQSVVNLSVLAAVSFSLVAVGGCAHSSESTRSTDQQDSNSEVEVGYGTQEKSEIVGSVDSVSSEAIEQRQQTSTHVAELLEGRVAGVRVTRTPGGGFSVRIRGESSILGSNEPLYVIDGVPVSGAGAGRGVYINPSDVASISVLKGPSAAIYGRRGANGVILIKTKRGGD